MTKAANPKGIPWSNCRLQLASELDEDADLPQGIVGRLYFSPVSHPAVRQSFQSLSPIKLSLPALAVQNLVNMRGPDGLVGRIPGETKHSVRLLQLCRSCHEAGEVLMCRIPASDVVLVPRLPDIAERDGLYFIAYATNVKAVELCESLRTDRKVAVVLDIDNTLVDATPAEVPDKADWDALDWVHTTVSTSSGRTIAGQWATVEGTHGESAHQERSFLIHWEAGRMSCTFLVRVRQGWAAFRDYLTHHKDKFETFVCSKGKSEYIQLIWLGLDPRGELLPRTLWPGRLVSTFPDSLVRAGQKTALVALGCADVMRPLPPMQVAAPVVFVDDSPDAYDFCYSDSILYVEEFRPSEAVHADRGSVLRQVAVRLDTYWSATCGEAGTFAWQAAQSFATAILGAMQRTPMESPDALAYLQVRCAKQGQALWHQITVASVFSNDVYVADVEAAEVDDDVIVKAHPLGVHSPQTDNGLSSSLSQAQELLNLHPLIRQGSLNEAQALMSPKADLGDRGAGGSADDPGGSRTAEDLLTAALMMRC